MSRRDRPKRTVKLQYKIFCEGDSEFNYFTGLKNRKNYSFAIKPVNMAGGARKRPEIVKNEFRVNPSKYEVKNEGPELITDNLGIRSTNIEDLFDILEKMVK